MSKFAVGERVDNSVDDHESGTVVAVFPTVDDNFRYAVAWRATARSSFFPSKDWLVTPAKPDRKPSWGCSDLSCKLKGRLFAQNGSAFLI